MGYSKIIFEQNKKNIKNYDVSVSQKLGYELIVRNNKIASEISELKKQIFKLEKEITYLKRKKNFFDFFDRKRSDD